MSEQKGYIVDANDLPDLFPTHMHESIFWEKLGRTVATFGFLEEMLAKAIFAFTGTRPYDESEVEEAFENWVPKLEKALSDQLGSLIDSYAKAVREHPDSKMENFDQLVEDLKKAAEIRNVLCHGSWKVPDQNGASVPFFVNRKKGVFQTPINCAFLDQVQKHASELAVMVVNSVTCMGWQFPGSKGPGRPIWTHE